MTASTFTSTPRRLPHLSFALCMLLWAIPSARADDVPLLRQGLWEFQRTAGTQKFAATECMDPSEDLRRQHAALERMGCKVAPVVRDGATYTYAADCALKLPSGVLTFSTATVLTAESDTAYRFERRMTNQGTTSSEVITGRRVTDCTE
ncbi:MAG TPA: DUF3617 family protein [Casimicrobiaceae bacterium]|jgi:hypothetical protein|nr:DUF3617 family protein [Casimicrobiaceae bacterium]